MGVVFRPTSRHATWARCHVPGGLKIWDRNDRTGPVDRSDPQRIDRVPRLGILRGRLGERVSRHHLSKTANTAQPSLLMSPALEPFSYCLISPISGPHGSCPHVRYINDIGLDLQSHSQTGRRVRVAAFGGQPTSADRRLIRPISFDSREGKWLYLGLPLLYCTRAPRSKQHTGRDHYVQMDAPGPPGWAGGHAGISSSSSISIIRCC